MAWFKKFLSSLFFLFSIFTLQSSAVYNITQGTINLNNDFTKIYNYLNASLPPDYAYKYLDTPSIARSNNYTCETHTIQTDDSYLLTYHRIPCGQNQGNSCIPGPPVLVQHGLFADSTYFLTQRACNVIVYLLADAGFDVWMGNARGNKYSLGHLFYNSSNPSSPYWKTGWNDMGKFDLPASITYILDKTGKASLSYLGHSMGTTMFFVMCVVRPDICEKVNHFIAYAPVLFAAHMESPIRIASPVLGLPNVQTTLVEAGQGVFFPSWMGQYINMFAPSVCGPGDLACLTLLMALQGFDYEQFDNAYLPQILSTLPSSTPTQAMVQYFQEMNCFPCTCFQEPDARSALNIALDTATGKCGNNTSIPQYDISKITCNKTLFYGLNDFFGDPTDVLLTKGRMPNTNYVPVAFKKWNHIDFTWGKDAFKFVHQPAIEILKAVNKIKTSNQNYTCPYSP